MYWKERFHLNVKRTCKIYNKYHIYVLIFIDFEVHIGGILVPVTFIVIFFYFFSHAIQCGFERLVAAKLSKIIC